MTEKKERISLDHQSPVPLFIQIAETLKRRILSGQYNSDEQSLTNEELVREFQASNVTIRKAVNILKSDGFVKRRRGFGTTVSKDAFEPVVFELSISFKKRVEAIERMQPEIKVLEIKTVPASKHVQDILSIPPHQAVRLIKRIRIYKKSPISVYTYYADPARCATITVKDAEKSDIIDTIERTMGCKICKIRQTLRSIVADLDISSVLEIPFGAPVLLNENKYLSESDVTVLFSQGYYRGDMFAFETTSHL
jgi:GntR family transcriptional regulator